jgi:hypothetical protein
MDTFTLVKPQRKHFDFNRRTNCISRILMVWDCHSPRLSASLITSFSSILVPKPKQNAVVKRRRKTFNKSKEKKLLLRNFTLEFRFIFFLHFPIWILNWKSLLPIWNPNEEIAPTIGSSWTIIYNRKSKSHIKFTMNFKSLFKYPCLQFYGVYDDVFIFGNSWGFNFSRSDNTIELLLK